MSQSEFQLIETPLKTGITFLEASAGTGKTYTISKIIVRLVVERQLPISEILVMTFTEAATKELKSRVRSAIQETLRELASTSSDDPLALYYMSTYPEAAKHLRNAIATFDEAAIFTIHGFCNRVLKEFAFESNRLFEPTLIKEQRPLWLEAIQDYWRSNHYEGTPFTTTLLHFHKQSPDSLLDTFLKFIRYPNIEVLPAVSDNLYANSQLALDKCWKDIQFCLSQNKTAVVKFLENTAVFKKEYKDHLPTILENLEGKWEDLPQLQKLFTLHLLTISNIRLALLKKYQDIPIHEPLFELSEQWTAISENFIHQHTFHCFREVERSLRTKKQNDNLLTFDDLLPSILDTLDSVSGPRLQKKIQQAYRAILVDEFQDTDSQQTELFRRLFISPEHLLFFIGDPKQAIYKFRGADLFSYLHARDLASQTYTLSTNWRSSSALVKGVNALFSRNPNPFLYDQIPYLPSIAALKNTTPTLNESPTRNPLRICFQESQDSKPIPIATAKATIQAALVQEILILLDGDQLLDGKPVQPVDIAILTRSNQEAQSVKAKLAEYNLPSVIFSDQTVFESEEVTQLILLLNAIQEPYRLDWIRSLYASSWFGWTAEEIYKRNTSSNEWTEIQDKFQQLHELWLSDGIAVCLDEWIRWSEIKPLLLSNHGGERSATNLLHLVELLSQAESEKRLSPIALIQWVQRSIEKPDRERDDFVTRLESDEQAIQIVTIHKSKGLQYPIVFVPFAWGSCVPRSETERIYHQIKANDQLVFDRRPELSKEDKAQYFKESLSDSCRLLYVALTRAQQACYLFWGDYKDQDQSSVGYLFRTSESTEPISPNAALELLKGENHNEIDFLNTDRLAERKHQAYQRFQNIGSLTARLITRTPDRGFSISSFSSLASGFKEAITDSLVEDEDVTVAIPDEDAEKSIFTFPKGTVAGNLIHDILEKSDLSNRSSISDHTQQLGSTSMIEDHWIPLLEEHLIQMLDCPLPESPSLKLSKLTDDLCLKEVEFHFPTRNASTRSLLSVFQKIADTHVKSALPNLQSWREHRLNGFLRGFIDLTFEWEGRIYILDWKSNWLGNHIEDYNQDAMKQSMADHAYFLQYYLYTVASLRYLKFRNPGFDYETQFGGVYYVFIRGLHKDHSQNGIFFDRPPLELILEIDQVFQSS